MHIKRILSATLCGSIVMLGASVVPANAHTPSSSASCTGVVVKGTSYDGSKANTWSVTINGKTESGTFGASVDKTFPVPQEGVKSTYSVTIASWDNNPKYGQTISGTVGPCGEKPKPPQPPADVEERDISDTNCDAREVVTQRQERTREYVYEVSDNEWKPGEWTEWVTKSTDTRAATNDECEHPKPEKPVDSQTRDIVGEPNCDANTITTVTEIREAIFVFDETTWTWQRDGWTNWETTAVDVVDTAANDCATVTTPPIEKPRTPVNQDIPAKTAAVLPNTGAPGVTFGVIGIVLAMVGAMVLWYNRRKLG